MTPDLGCRNRASRRGVPDAASRMSTSVIYLMSCFVVIVVGSRILRASSPYVTQGMKGYRQLRLDIRDGIPIDRNRRFVLVYTRYVKYDRGETSLVPGRFDLKFLVDQRSEHKCVISTVKQATDRVKTQNALQ